ncbi:MAG: Anthranilate synthase, component I [Thermoanaerobacterales bacterium 50_218]|nr:MAG: Anthranilate synthase, component I [Thermoanaerobacterales bacterium 50_218]
MYLKLEKYLPVWEEFLADTETPVSLYLRFGYQRPGSFLLESAEGGEHLGRYSIIGFEPLMVFTSRGREIEIARFGKDVSENSRSRFKANPFEVIRQLMGQLTEASFEELPRFGGGFVGYFGYDLVRHLERLPELAVDDLLLPDAFLVLNRFYLIYDHLRHRVKAVCLVPASGGRKGFEEARSRIRAVCDQVAHSCPKRWLDSCSVGELLLRDDQEIRPNMTPEEFATSVERIKKYITTGDVFQVVLSQRLSLSFQGDTFEVYRRLRSLNPSPYMFYLHFPGVDLVGSSPEMLVRVEGEKIETRPIAGTRPRGRDFLEDQYLARELLADEKERAEHLMLVDLGRNDLGRVAQPGSVEVPQFMEVEKYSHVMHLVSSVTGVLAPEKTPLDALVACFPAGTVSGAPKVRAMEIIEELEPTRRGPYAGAVGYLGLNGNLDTCITIRTLLFCRGKAYVQVGAGIVADSDPGKEYQETLAKAAALLQVLREEGRQKKRMSCF